ncbi:MAG TPA: hypothetical protein VNE42_09225 [Acidimicrobiales bacterium]|nr:hypothetical protein [Acidimicrobiales bacterium]
MLPVALRTAVETPPFGVVVVGTTTVDPVCAGGVEEFVVCCMGVVVEDVEFDPPVFAIAPAPVGVLVPLAWKATAPTNPTAAAVTMIDV